MPRLARTPSEGSVYHVVQRGVGQQILFENDQDRERYLELVEKYAADAQSEGPILAWCLMSNHVHLLVRMELQELSNFMRRLGTAYARYFNDTHNRSGHLFQDRYKSEPVDTDEYLLAVVRYIHANPVGVECDSAADYRWSSYREYTGERAGGVTATDFVLDMFGSVKAFEEFHRHEDHEYKPLDVDGSARRFHSDDQALQMAKGVLGNVSIYEIKGLAKSKRDASIVKLRRAGLSVRQIARLTGLGANIVARAKAESE